MSGTTTNLGLTTPELTDKVKDTIPALANNLNTLDQKIGSPSKLPSGIADLMSGVASNAAQLADNTNNLKSKFINVMYPPAPLVAAKGDGINDDLGTIQGCINYFSGSGGVLYLPQPSNFYRITNELNLINPNVIGSGTIELIGESQLNTIIKLDNNSAQHALNYDNGTKRIDVANCSSTSGSNIITTTGDFNQAGITVGMGLNMSFVPETATVTAINSPQQITISKNASQTTSSQTAMFYNLITSTHRISLKDLYIKNTYNYASFSTWHPAVGINLKGANNNIIENVRVDGFTKGLYSLGGFISKYDTLNANSCYDGIVLEYACFGTNLIKPIGSGIGSTSGGNPISLINTGSVQINNPVIENNKRGILLKGVRGFDLKAGNVESTIYDYTITTVHMDNIDPTDTNYWTSGGVISGFRFYEALGVLIADGSSDIEIKGNSFVGSPTSFTPGTGSCIYSSSTDYKNIKDINYGNNRYYPGGSPNRHILTSTLSSPQSFTENGKRYATAVPYYGKYWNVGDEVLNSAPAASGFRGWICVTASNGISDGTAVWKTFGAISA